MSLPWWPRTPQPCAAADGSPSGRCSPRRALSLSCPQRETGLAPDCGETGSVATRSGYLTGRGARFTSTVLPGPEATAETMPLRNPQPCSGGST